MSDIICQSKEVYIYNLRRAQLYAGRAQLYSNLSFFPFGYEFGLIIFSSDSVTETDFFQIRFSAKIYSMTLALRLH